MMNVLRTMSSVLAAEGFRSNGAGVYRRRKTVARLGDGWLGIETAAPVGTDPTDADSLVPGPFKPLSSASGQPGRWVCELPLVAFEGFEEDALEEALRAALLWPLALIESRHWEWRQPRREDLDEWFPPAARSVRAGTVAKVIELTLDADRLALSCGLVRCVTALPPAHAEWLSRAALGWQQQWRMVRLARHADAGLAAEIDLTGLPASCAEVLIRAAGDALRGALPALLPAVDVLSDRNAGLLSLTAVNAGVNEAQNTERR